MIVGSDVMQLSINVPSFWWNLLLPPSGRRCVWKEGTREKNRSYERTCGRQWTLMETFLINKLRDKYLPAEYVTPHKPDISVTKALRS